ncbi:hypothetical protein B0H10DRAFT_2324189 [Mycena sp. CBHHK59/15]|nr:hypothetical protein B0H10DRAFT_2324189 [Mycena sp. CBHHK59/15]
MSHPGNLTPMGKPTDSGFWTTNFLSYQCPARSPFTDIQLLARLPRWLKSDVNLAYTLERSTRAFVWPFYAPSIQRSQILGWAGYIKVDGLAWHWLGSPVPGNASTWISTEVTPTRTIITARAGPMLLKVTFRSPVEPSDWSLQSFPFACMYVDGVASDGKQHSVQLYSDISAEWVTNSLSTSIEWNTTTTSNTAYHQVHSINPVSVFTDVAEDSIAYYAMGVVSQSCLSSHMLQFATPGTGFTLTSDLPAQFGTVRDPNTGKFPVFAFAVNLGLTTTMDSVVWAMGLARDPVLTTSGSLRSSYFRSQHSIISDVIFAFMEDFPAAEARASSLDSRILKDASVIGPQYGDLLSLVTRQAMAGVEITVSKTSQGSWNLSDVQGFMKDLGNSGHVNPTETIYSALPTFLYLNASLAGILLELLLQFQSSTSYNNSYAAPDTISSNYPNAPGNPADNSVYGVENSGNMLILALAHARASGDGTLLNRYVCKPPSEFSSTYGNNSLKFSTMF